VIHTAIYTIVGFLVGVLVNLLADYLPAQRYRRESLASPFSTSVPPVPRFAPNVPITRFHLWSGIVSALLRKPTFDPPRTMRRAAVEIGLAVAYAWVGTHYATDPHLPLLLFYGAVFALIAVIDVERRWILAITIYPPMLIALAEAAFFPRVSLESAVRGGLYAFGALYAAFLGGLVFAQIMALFTGKRIGRTVLGFGDVLIAALIGVILGTDALGTALLITAFSGGLAALIFIIGGRLRRKRRRKFAAIPYAPYLVLGAAVMLYVPWIGAEILIWLIAR
jgi:prepilin signal peptidase PulO-like enzyme (type II secretory pathway)